MIASDTPGQGGEALALIHERLRKENVGNYVGGVILLLGALGFELCFGLAGFREALHMPRPTKAMFWVVHAIALLLTGGGLYYFRRGWLTSDITQHPLWLLLTEHPEDVVWVHDHLEIVQRMNGVEMNRQRHVFFLTIEPKRNQRLACPVDVAEQLMAELPSLLPHACIGWRPGLGALYRQSPSLLRSQE